MAGPAVIQVPQIWAKLVRNLGLKTRSPAPELGGVVHPVVVVDDHTVKNILDTQTERPFCSSAEYTSAVNAPGLIFLNPAAAGVIVRLTHLTGRQSTLNQIYGEFVSAGGTPEPVAQTQYTDRRLAGQPAMQSSIDEVAIIATPAMIFAGGTNTFSIVPLNIILPPGQGVHFQLALVGVQTLGMTVYGFEYQLT